MTDAVNPILRLNLSNLHQCNTWMGDQLQAPSAAGMGLDIDAAYRWVESVDLWSCHH